MPNSRGKHKEFLPIFMSISALLFFSSLVGGNVGSKELYDNNRERYDIKDELIDSIPENASVACDSFYLPHLAQRDEIYLLDSNDVEPPSFTDFVIVRTEQNEEWEDQEVSKLQTEGYVYYDGCQDMMDIYVSPEYLAEHPDLQLAEKNVLNPKKKVYICKNKTRFRSLCRVIMKKKCCRCF